MEVKKNTLFPKVLSFLRIEKDVLIFLIFGFVICYIIPVALVLTVSTEDLFGLITLLSGMFALKIFLPALCIFVFNKIILIPQKEKIIKQLKIIKKILHIIFAFYLIYWQLFIIVFFIVLFCEENWTLR